MRNFLRYYRQLADVWTLFDNSGEIPETVALARGGNLRIIKIREFIQRCSNATAAYEQSLTRRDAITD